jgi:HSP20 family molecular chaperone IbpA
MSDVIKKNSDPAVPAAKVTEYLDYAPPCDVIESKTDIAVVLDVPGASSEQLSVHLENRILKIDAETNLTRNGKQVRYSRSFQVSNEIAHEKIAAAVKDGVLRVLLPKADAAKARKIKVTAEA